MLKIVTTICAKFHRLRWACTAHACRWWCKSSRQLFKNIANTCLKTQYNVLKCKKSL